MVNYSCSTCHKIFKQKGHYDSHLLRKRPCVKDDTIDKLIERKVEEILQSKTHTEPNVNILKHIKYVDLFAGIGGFRYGIEEFQRKNPKFQFECIKTVDIKKDALNTYNLNFGEENKPCDIRTVKDLPHFELLCAGFPCQPFSSAGKKEGFDDATRGNLIYEVIRICTESNPSFLVLENVSNIEKLQNGAILQRIIQEFTDIGYAMSYKTINSMDVGLAQDRERTFIFGTKTTAVSPNIILKLQHSKQVISDIIDVSDKHTDIPKQFLDTLLSRDPVSLYGMSIKDKRGGDKNLHSWDINYHGTTTTRQRDLLNAILKERRKKTWAKAKEIVWMDGMPLTTPEIETFTKYTGLQDDLDDLTEKGYLTLEHPKDLVDGKREYKETSPKGYNICKGKLSFPISKVLDPKGYCPTLTATDSSKLAVYNAGTIRRLNKTELCRLCGFPERLKIADSANMYDLFGNMVCPPVVTSILECIFG